MSKNKKGFCCKSWKDPHVLVERVSTVVREEPRRYSGHVSRPSCLIASFDPPGKSCEARQRRLVSIRRPYKSTECILQPTKTRQSNTGGVVRYGKRGRRSRTKILHEACRYLDWPAGIPLLGIGISDIYQKCSGILH
jgi:hypothetical protein